MRHVIISLLVTVSIGCVRQDATEASPETTYVTRLVSGFHIMRRSPLTETWAPDVRCFENTRSVFVTPDVLRGRPGEIYYTYDSGMELIAKLREGERLTLYAPADACKTD